ELRDSALFFARQLDRTPAEATATPLGIDLDKPINHEKDRRRTVYLPVARNNPTGETAIFDGANPDLVTGRRSATTVPTQALYLLNSEFLLGAARAVGVAALAEGGPAGSEIDRLYLTLLGRRPDPVE